MNSSSDEPDIVLPFRRQSETGKRLRPNRFLIAFVLLFVGFLVVHNSVPLYTDWLWFGEVGHRQVFSKVVLTKTALFFLFGGVFFALFYGNVWLARRLAPEEADHFLAQQFGAGWGAVIQRGIKGILLGTGLILSLFAGRIAAEEWANALTFQNAESFQVKDPVFGLDVGFFVFRLPFLQFLAQFLLISMLITAGAVVFIHVIDRAIESWSGLPNMHPRVRAQLLTLAAGLALIHAFGTRLDAYELLFRDNGQFSGAGYSDVTYRLLAYNVQVACLLFVAAACVLTIKGGKNFRWPTIGVGAWLIATVLLGGILPGIGQRLYVVPNQIEREQEFISRNIAFTRKGFGLENVQRIEGFPADESLTAAGLHANRDTLDNTRLWDHTYLGKVYNQLQSVKTYYRFEQNTLNGTPANNVDIDRYSIGGQTRQVMLAAREMNLDGLPKSAQTWQNRRLGYTHGYGLVMSPVNRVKQGEPDYFVQGFPPLGSKEAANIKISRPEIYYGLLTSDYVFTATAQQEFDYPATDAANGLTDHYNQYEGKGGITVGNGSFSIPRLAFSLLFGDTNILLTQGFKPSTRILYRRDVRERVQTVAPFLQLDSDPYLVATDSGRLTWVVDAYTLTDRYPYSSPQNVAVGPMSFIAPNYIRNSVKATVDAYDGSVNLYLADPKDPIIRVWNHVFPGLLQPLDQMPDGLRAHLRYPEDLFRLQRSVYAIYHVDEPRTFYLREDVWAVPVEPNPDNPADTLAAGQKLMEPYYVVMRLPGTTITNRPPSVEEEFVLMSPLAPINREDKNILGWMCARCDGDNYGQLVLYRFPQKVAVNGPSQIISLVNSEPTISKELSLLRQSGSSAKFGNVLVLPIETSLLYIAPLYIEATNSSNIPQLQRVVVAFGQHVVMEETLGAALAKLFPGYDAPDSPKSPGTPGKTPADTTPASDTPRSVVPTAVRTLIEKAAAQYESAQQKLKAGDFAAYGAATRELERTLKELKSAARP